MGREGDMAMGRRGEKKSAFRCEIFVETKEMKRQPVRENALKKAFRMFRTPASRRQGMGKMTI